MVGRGHAVGRPDQPALPGERMVYGLFSRVGGGLLPGMMLARQAAGDGAGALAGRSASGRRGRRLTCSPA